MFCSERKKSLFGNLQREELKLLEKGKYSVHYSAGEVICRVGAKPRGLLCLKKGKVKVTRRRINGSDQIVGLKKAVNFLGFKALMSDEHCRSSTIALENCQVCVIERENFVKVVERNKELAFKIMKLLANELRKSENRLINLTQKHLKGRLAETLILIYETYGVDLATGNLNVDLKRSDLAGLSNMTTANAIRVLGSFKKAKLVSVHKKDIKLLDLEGLRRISVFDV